MRITFYQILLGLIFTGVAYSNSSNAQGILDKQISISMKNKSIDAMIMLLKNNYKIQFIYSKNTIDVNQRISIKKDDVPLKEILDEVLIRNGIEYEVLKERILLSDCRTPSILPLLTNQENKMDENISGTILDDSGRPLVGVSILEKGTKNSTSTDANGQFKIAASGRNSVLIVSYIGFVTQEVVVGENKKIKITLHEDIAQLDQVVVVGYGVQKKSDVTGSISSVPKDRLKNLPVTNVIQAIQGAVAGVNVASKSSAPGSSPSFYIRGLKSISASNDPLIVLDGIPFSGSYNDINPNDIDAIDILKDVSATAIYGSRGANGVVLITTKRGKLGKAVISYNAYFGPENVANELTPMNPEQYVRKNRVFNQQIGRPGAPDVPNLYEQENYAIGKTTNWMDEVFRPGLIQNHELSVSGGTEGLKYYVSGTYLKQKGVMKDYQYNRFSLRSNLDVTITPWLKAGTNLFMVNNNADGGKADLLMAASMSPYGRLLNAKGNYEVYPMYPELLFTNPLLGLYQPTIDRKKNISGNVYAEIQPLFIKGLKYRVNGSYTYRPDRLGDYAGRTTGNLVGSASIGNREGKNWLVENILQYSKSIGKHALDFTGLYSAQKDERFNSDIKANTFINDNLAFYNVGSGQVQSATSSYSANSLVSEMFRFNYAYDSRYLFTATVRRDGYSGFGKSNKYASFPSVALGWNIEKESFMKDISMIESLKLRGSYGISGNQGVDPYQTLTKLSVLPYVYDGITAIGLVPSAIGNSNLKWESTRGYNLGLDFALWGGRLTGAIEAYKTKTYNLLLLRQIPTITGYSSILDNVGSTANKGLEITMNSFNIKKTDFSWQTNFNISFNRNKVLSLYGDQKDDIANRLLIGKPLRAIYDYRMAGIWQEGDDFSVDPGAKPGFIKFVDLNGDNKINASDREYLGTGLPKYIAGLTNTFKYKNFSLGIFVQSFQGALKSNLLYDARDMTGRANLPAALPYWTAENKINTNPSLVYTNPRSYTYPTSLSFVRIKDITLSYNFKQNILDKLKLSNLMIYASGKNIKTFTNWVGWDPEQEPSSAGDQTNGISYPLTSTVVFGVNIGL